MFDMTIEKLKETVKDYLSDTEGDDIENYLTDDEIFDDMTHIKLACERTRDYRHEVMVVLNIPKLKIDYYLDDYVVKTDKFDNLDGLNSFINNTAAYYLIWEVLDWYIQHGNRPAGFSVNYKTKSGSEGSFCFDTYDEAFLAYSYKAAIEKSLWCNYRCIMRWSL